MYVDNEFVKEYDKLIWDCIHKAGMDREGGELRAAIYARILNSHNYDPEKGKVSTWIYMICRSVIRNMQDHMRRMPNPIDRGIPLDSIKNKIGDEDADALAAPPDATDTLNDLFNRIDLSERDKDLVRDHYLNEYTVLEVAVKHRMKYNSAQKAITRALKALRQVAKPKLNGN